jgi:hypothetical protein
VQPERLCQLKILVTPPGIEPATLWLVVQCLNQLRHCMRHTLNVPSCNEYWPEDGVTEPKHVA